MNFARYFIKINKTMTHYDICILGCGDEKKTKMYQVALWKTKDKNPLISL
jgi:hypothetical protein